MLIVFTSFSPLDPIWLSNVHCTGSEYSLLSCSNSGYGTGGCTHDYDIGVVCSDSKSQ